MISICHHLCWQPLKNNLTADSLGLVNMERYTIEQHVLIAEHCLRNNESLSAAVQKFHTKHRRNSVLTSSSEKRLIEKFKNSGSVRDVNHSGSPKITC